MHTELHTLLHIVCSQHFISHHGQFAVGAVEVIGVEKEECGDEFASG
jgi:hypothetical protein